MNDADPPQVTVVIPAYKAERTIRRAVDSVLGQEGCAARAVVVVDGDLDGTARLLEAYEPDRVRTLINFTNRGVQETRNRGLTFTQDPFVMFLDADDFIEGRLLAGLAGAMGASGAELGIGPMQVLHERDGRREPVITLDTGNVERLFTGWLGEGRFVAPCSVLWRTGFLRRIGGWDPELKRQEDGEIVLRALLLGARVVGTNEGRGIYVHHEAPDRLTRRSDNLDSLLKVPAKLAGIPSAAVPPERARRAAALSFYNAARTCYVRGEEALGAEALNQARAFGFKGHRGNLLHRLLCGILGFPMRCKLERRLRLALGKTA